MSNETSTVCVRSASNGEKRVQARITHLALTQCANREVYEAGVTETLHQCQVEGGIDFWARERFFSDYGPNDIPHEMRFLSTD